MTTIDRRLAVHRSEGAPAARRRTPGRSVRALALVAVLGVAGTVGACNTTRGVGEDVSAAGDALATSAEDNKAY
jgi:predicted small secreted protein